MENFNLQLLATLLILIIVTFVLLKKDGVNSSSFFMQNKKYAKNKFLPAIGRYTIDFSQMARDKKIDPVIGREQEIKRVIQILSRRKKNNVILIGKAGIGKTAVIEGLALAIASGNVPETLLDKTVLKLDISSILAGAKYRGEFEDRFKSFIDAIVSLDKKIIVFIDEIHTIVQAGGAEGAIDADDIIKPALARGELQMVGTTTVNEYKEFILPDITLARRFQALLIKEPSKQETFAILKGVKSRYEDYHQVIISDDIIRQIINFASKVKDNVFPDKAIDIMDEVSAKVRLDNINNPNKVKVAVKDLKEVLNLFSEQKF